MTDLQQIKVKHNGLWFYGARGEIITIIETKDIDNLKLAIQLTEKLAGASDTEHFIISMKPGS